MESSLFNRIHPNLLDWYDVHQRHLPWRAIPKVSPNPYHVLLSEVMLQQTTVVTVIDYFNRFIQRWPTLQDLALANQESLYHQWQGLGYYSRAKNLHACIQKLAQEHAHKIPQSPEELIKLPGIGPYTAASIAAIAYDYPVIPVDGNITRVMARLLAIETPLPGLKNEIFRLVSPLEPKRAGDFAQALMDLGATICKPKTPLCGECPLQIHCKSRLLGQQQIIPLTRPKPLKPTRYTYAFWCQDDQKNVFLQQRPEKGLLANMVGLPTSEWVEDEAQLPIIHPEWVAIPKAVKHTFTHFHLIMKIFIVNQINQVNVFKVKPENFQDFPIPTLMTKAIKTCLNRKNT